MGWSTDLVDGIAAALVAAGVGVWRPDGPTYTASEVAIVAGAMPPDPDRVVCLNLYTIDDHVSLLDSLIGLQVRVRGDRDPRTVLDLDDAVFAALDGIADVRWGDVDVSQVIRRTGTPIGRDGQDREERTSTYHIHASRPSAALSF